MNDEISIGAAQLIYALAHCETWLEDYAKSNRLPAYVLTERVATLLLSQTGREILGTEYNMPKVRTKTAKGNKTARKMAVAYSTRAKMQNVNSQKSYWYNMSAKERKIEMKRRMAMWKKGKKRAA